MDVGICVTEVGVFERLFQTTAVPSRRFPVEPSDGLSIAVRSQCAIWKACSQAAVWVSEHKVDIAAQLDKRVKHIPEAHTRSHPPQLSPTPTPTLGGSELEKCATGISSVDQSVEP